MKLTDRHGRPLENLRLSVTDRCNLRCAYCMPEAEYSWLPKDDLLTFDEIDRLVDAFVEAGVSRVRLTGGEPLLRRDLDVLVAKLAAKRGVKDLAITTNGVLLAEQARALRAAGLHRVTVSLDTLDPKTFVAVTRRDAQPQVIAGIRAARDAGFTGTKLDTVVLRGTNDHEMFDLLAFAREVGAELRFIEYMDVGGATRWSMAQVVPRHELLARVAARLGPVTPLAAESPASAPAERFALRDGTTFGIIASTTAPFCGKCDRSRLTADGTWYLCLYARVGIDLKTPLRAGESVARIRERIEAGWNARTDRGAEDRLRDHARGASIARDDLRDDPRLEMHTRGG